MKKYGLSGWESFYIAVIVQLVEWLICTQLVAGSIPAYSFKHEGLILNQVGLSPSFLMQYSLKVKRVIRQNGTSKIPTAFFHHGRNIYNERGNLLLKKYQS